MKSIKLKKLITTTLLLSMTTSLFVGCKKSNEYEGYPEYKVSDYVTLGNYKNLKVQTQQIEETPTNEEIESYMKKLVTADIVKDEDKDNTAKKGDILIIDFEGNIDGKKVKQGTARGMTITLGENRLLKGFEDKLVGMKRGEKKSLKISFPQDYENEDVAGKTADFEVQIKQIARPKLTDESVRESSNGTVKTIKELKKIAKDDLIAINKEKNRELAKTAIFAKIAETSKIKNPPKKLEKWYVNSKITDVKIQAKNKKMEINEFIKQDSYIQNKYGIDNIDDLRVLYEKEAKKPLKYEMLLTSIAEKEKIKVSDKEYNEKIEIMARQNGFKTKEDFEEKMGKGVIKHKILIDNTVDFLIKNNNVEKIKTNIKELE